LTRISARSAGDVILKRLESGLWEASGEAREQARVWLTGADGRGFAALRCLSGHETEDRSHWLEQQRLMWRQILDDLDGRETLPPENGDFPPALSPVFRDEVMPALASAAQMLVLLTEQGSLAGRSPLAGKLFLRNCERLQQILDACKPLASLGRFWRELVQDRGGAMEETLRLTSLLAGHLGRWAQYRGE
jgi:hypothetical protein